MWRKGEKRIFTHHFQPAASPKALTRTSRVIRGWALHKRSDKSLTELAKMCIRGWITYYSHFRKMQLRPTLERVNAYIRGQSKGAGDWFDRFRRANPKLFVYWSLCHGNGRTMGAV
jgi:RNA-directed DNA polymerase